DDTIYGGGAGMLIRPDVVGAALQKVENTYKIALSPKGDFFTQDTAKVLSTKKSLTLVCGRYEGFDARTLEEMDKVISIGPYITMGGELPAMIIIESVSRLIKGVLGNVESLYEESYTKGLRDIEYPLYTKPYEYKGKKVPEVLLSGNHQKIKEWKEKNRPKGNK
ncbi:MAG TPA: tRNA (guanosine(37)-N1)-methyltransferase TrmD, partial [candidate division WWE3 bacterium]|nr:tRNA (guanosine(37)-N1)-methyltransferase TrmD [candidate division WWE3 bacterium]